MEVTAVARFARIAPRKARTIVNLVRGRKVAEAIDTLMFTRRSAAPIVRKVIESALANAKHKAPGVDIDTLYVSVASVDKGPTGNMRRWRPRAQGRATRIEKGVSHIAVTLSDREPLRVVKKTERKAAYEAKKKGAEESTNETAAEGSTSETVAG
jgi:large subunit ribosomal protein L22